MLLSKAKKPSKVPSAYRPICLIYTAGKVLERIVFDRINTYPETHQEHSEKQFEFRKTRSSVVTNHKVVKSVREAIEGKR